MLLHVKSIFKSLGIAIIIFLLFLVVCGTKTMLGASIIAIIAFIGSYSSFLYERHKLKK